MKAKAGRRNAGWWNREFRVGSVLLLLYGLALAGSDPVWATWAGAMATGVLVMEAPPPMTLSPSDLFPGAGTLAVLGLSAFAALPLFQGGDVRGRLAAPWGRAPAWRGGHGGSPGTQ